MNTEDTILDNNGSEVTQQSEEITIQDNLQKTEKSNGVWKKVAMGAGVGLVFGTGATILSTATAANKESNEDVPAEDNQETGSQSSFVGGDVAVASSVNDDMTFAEAFAGAREEVGSGGVFEWHGNVYSTYTAEEWDSMAPDHQSEYTQSVSVSTEEQQPQQEEPIADKPATDGDVDVIGTDEPEVEVLGVTHDTENDINVGGMLIDGQEVVLIDVDNDQAFDLMAVDENSDNLLSENEILDISDMNLTVNDLGGFNDAGNNLYASNDAVDYTNDAADYVG